MLRRWLAALLVLVLAAPAVAPAAPACGMTAAEMTEAPCDCCDEPGASPCHDDATTDAGCGCSLRSEPLPRPQYAPQASPAFENPTPDVVLLPAVRSAPRRERHARRDEAPPPRHAPSRPALCVWTI